MRALTSLDHSLRQRGSALIVRVGPWEQQLPALAAEFGAAAVVAEAEVEAGEYNALCLSSVHQAPCRLPAWGVQPTSYGSKLRGLTCHMPWAPPLARGATLSMLCLSIAADWCAGVAAAAATLPQGVALKQWRAPLLASHADDFRGERWVCTG